MPFDDWILTMLERRASDLILKPGLAPTLRVGGTLEKIDGEVLTEPVVTDLFRTIAQPRHEKSLQERGEVDLAWDVGATRIRANFFRQRGHLCAVLRRIATAVGSFEDLGLPMGTLSKLAESTRGLLLVTGTAGSGKSTTLAAMIEHMNRTTRRHIVTIEDPIEYLFRDGQCVIEQREVGLDTLGYFEALKHVVRQSPDVILIGEMRDADTVQAAISAAQTGHLVMSTLHTVSAKQTVERILNYFDPGLHATVRMELSLVLRGIVSQRLVRVSDGTMVPATEILVGTPTIQELLREGKSQALQEAMRDGAFFGMNTFNQSLKSLVTGGRISMEEALRASDAPDDLKLEMRGISRAVLS
ncbi:MAG: PilT/PilU family type 4a pilus ATPase [Planctomycetes bacterium]|nr:PilT/PilU family type 4a pilus ATPase [Planctomycetota bacterium]